MTFRTTAKVAAAACLAFVLGAAGAAAAPEVGKPAPDFTGVDTHGKTHTLKELRGKTVILEWSNDGCPYVQKHYGSGNMQKLQKDTTADGIVWLTIVSSAPGAQGNLPPAEHDALMLKRDAAPSAVLIDQEGTIGRAYGAQTTPHMYIITPDGNLAYKGAIDDKPTANQSDIEGARNYVREALEQIAAGKPVDPAVTRAYGCSIKYKTS
ncbi:thioredoxin family protein [Filomicrobium sp.]|uniref:thioredoxin family protein n=1 Tax=Filomicrobium sp. TaxID=2024831 RepID=UPI00258A51AD|nr:thioredoxin family protein [Filomicrobium sp.]MCV0371289.1 thioredoxin family protein [Filomicrobium sp.]